MFSRIMFRDNNTMASIIDKFNNLIKKKQKEIQTYNDSIMFNINILKSKLDKLTERDINIQSIDTLDHDNNQPQFNLINFVQRGASIPVGIVANYSVSSVLFQSYTRAAYQIADLGARRAGQLGYSLPMYLRGVSSVANQARTVRAVQLGLIGGIATAIATEIVLSAFIGYRERYNFPNDIKKIINQFKLKMMELEKCQSFLTRIKQIDSTADIIWNNPDCSNLLEGSLENFTNLWEDIKKFFKETEINELSISEEELNKVIEEIVNKPEYCFSEKEKITIENIINNYNKEKEDVQTIGRSNAQSIVMHFFTKMPEMLRALESGNYKAAEKILSELKQDRNKYLACSKEYQETEIIETMRYLIDEDFEKAIETITSDNRYGSEYCFSEKEKITIENIINNYNKEKEDVQAIGRSNAQSIVMHFFTQMPEMLRALESSNYKAAEKILSELKQDRNKYLACSKEYQETEIIETMRYLIDEDFEKEIETIFSDNRSESVDNNVHNSINITKIDNYDTAYGNERLGDRVECQAGQGATQRLSLTWDATEIYHFTELYTLLNLRLQAYTKKDVTILEPETLEERFIANCASKITDLLLAHSIPEGETLLPILRIDYDIHIKQSNHWVGIYMNSNNSSIIIRYLDSELEGLNDTFRNFICEHFNSRCLNKAIIFESINLEQQKGNNCGPELIENFVFMVTGERVSQEHAIYLHSLLLENSLLDAEECQKEIEKNTQSILYLSNKIAVFDNNFTSTSSNKNLNNSTRLKLLPS